ncbi:hypothetical protein HanPI659440_Chr14g0542951 [Helianthus annuus]|nr:hypothetical protein HanPI659440_Chr14g0542951 [Helianthus annuus]
MLFSYKYNQKLGICDRDGLAICSGFTTSHVIPICNLSLCSIYVIMIIANKSVIYFVLTQFINGEPVYEASCKCRWLSCHRLPTATSFT